MLNERIADAKADAEAKGRPIKDHIAMLEQALREFATLHRADPVSYTHLGACAKRGVLGTWGRIEDSG